MKKRTKDKWSHKLLGGLGWMLKKVLGKLAGILFFPVFSAAGYRRLWGEAEDEFPRRLEQGNPSRRRSRWYYLWRVGREALLRAVALPALVVVCTAILVWVSVHTGRMKINSFPEGLRLYYEDVEFRSEDGTLLRGWFIPSLNADEVAYEGEQALRRQRPGAVLCHGLGSNRAQLLPMAGYLNRNGYEVLLFDFRNCGLSEGDALSYGLRERKDVLAAVHYLAGRPSVDPKRIAVIGQDVGGVAALGAAALDHSIRAIVIAGVEKDLQTAVSTRLSKVGMIGDFFSTAYVLGYKTYFRAHDRQLSSWELAESLGENQSLLIFSRKDQMSVKEGAAGIAKYAPGETQIAILGSEYSQVLTNASGVGSMVVEFLDSALGTGADNGS